MPIPGVTIEDVDAYSDVSNGSTISVGSAASGGSGHMPRPPTGGSKRPKSGQGRRSRVATSPYSSSQLRVSSKQQPPKPAARNMWITAMRNGTATLSTENSPMKTFAGSRPSYGKQSRTGTRAKHLSDFVPVEDLKNKNHIRSASMSASEPQLAGGGPAYKPQEDYYDEVIELKKIINALKAENSIINTKLRRVEGENVLKDRKMEDLLNQRKQPEDVRRTLTDKKGDTSAIVNSLKQKLHAVERTVKDKEAELTQLKRDVKMTNIEELQIQSETYYQEVQRLQLAVLEMQQSQVHDHFGRTSPSPRGSKGKPSTMTLQRLAEENDHLKAENRSLKKDLLTAIENSASGEKKVLLKAEYADMNRGQLLSKIRELEEKIQDSDGKKTRPRKGSLFDDEKADAGPEVRRKSLSKLAEVPGRIELKGSTSQKLAQLQEREVELLEEREKQREIIERLKEDRAHYRAVADDLRIQLKSTEEEQDTLKGGKTAEGGRRRSSAASLSSPRRLSVKEPPPPNENDDDLDGMLKDFQEQRAAKALQRQWRGYQGRKQRIKQEEEVRQNQAAVTLQKNWRRHRDRTAQNEDGAKEEAITEIQAALRGQAVRSRYIEQLDDELEMTDRDDAIVAIQSAMRGHSARRKHLREPGDELETRDTRTRGSSSHALLGSEPESDDGLVTRSSSGRRHPEPAIRGPRRSSLTGSRSRVISAPRFSNISEHGEDEYFNSAKSKSNQSRSGGQVNESAYKKPEQRPKKKTYEIVDSDDDDDDDDDGAVVSRPRRSLDTGMNQERPSLSRSTRAVGPPGASEDKIRSMEGRSVSPSSFRGIRSPLAPATSASGERVRTVDGRPGLSRASGNLAVNRDVEDSESGREDNIQRPGLARSKRPMSGKRPGLNRSGSRDKESESPRASSSGRYSVPADSEEDSDEDGEVVSGRKTKPAGGGGRAGARPSLTRRSPASTLPASSQRETLSNSLDTFFSSTVPSKGSSSKKSPRKTPARVNESDDDDDDDDDDDGVVVSSFAKFNSKQKETSRRDSRDSVLVADLWATSDKRGDSTKRKSSIKSSKKNTWSPEFEFEKPPRRPESQLDELF